jgi:hypothetical protein
MAPISATPLKIPELLEYTLTNLSHRGITNARLVSQFWKSLIDSSASMQKQLWKRSEFTKDQYAHFEKTWEDLVKELCPLGAEAFLRVYEALLIVLTNKKVDANIWEIYHDEEREFREMIEARYLHGFNDNIGSYGPLLPPLTACTMCKSLHPGFKYQHIHPLLKGLQNLVCITGTGPTLLVNIGVTGDIEFPLLVTRLIKLGNYLLENGALCKKFGSDMFCRPVCTRLVVTEGRACLGMKDKIMGLTLDDTVGVLAMACHTALRRLDGWDFATHVELILGDDYEEHMDGLAQGVERLQITDSETGKGTSDDGSIVEVSSDDEYEEEMEAVEKYRDQLLESIEKMFG